MMLENARGSAPVSAAIGAAVFVVLWIIFGLLFGGFVAFFLAALIGLAAGFIAFRGTDSLKALAGPARDERAAERDATRAERADTAPAAKEAPGAMSAAAGTTGAAAVTADDTAPPKAETAPQEAPQPPAETPPRPAPAPAPDPAPAPAPAPGPEPEAPVAGARPATLDAPRGEPDDLKKIKGIGPKIEQMLHEMGYYHFDQIAAWGPDEIAWVDQNLEGFKGRVSRDDWVSQARELAGGGATEFSQRVEKGGVYDD